MADKRAAPAVWIATCAGAGYFPVAPGTAGSAVGLAAVAALSHFSIPSAWAVGILAGAAVTLFALGVWAGGLAEKHFGRADPGQVVIDEVVGQMITFLWRPDARWKWLITGFILFRVFDVLKPFPARRAERVPGGWGIMLDDVVAGAYSLATLALLQSVWK